MKIQSQEQILDQTFRAQVIKEILGKENLERKNSAKKTFDLLKDRNKKWVVESLRNENLSNETIATMTNRAGNVSLFRRVVEKLARTYKGGVIRVAESPVQTDQIEKIEDLIDLNKQMKKADKWLEAFKNCLAQIVPVKNYRESTPENTRMDLMMRIFAPYQYDVLNYSENPEKGAVFILSDFHDNSKAMLDLSTARAKYSGTPRGVNHPEVVAKSSDFVDQTIADQDDSKNSEFIWWSDSYHFTTNEKGEVIETKSPEDLLNPIGLNCFVEMNEDQDGVYWAEGGEDLIDSCILVNKLITDMNSIAYQQGWGQPVITGGESLPEKFTIGTQNAIILQYDKERDPAPSVDIIQGNPPIDQWLSLIEQYVALTLSTNSLTPGNVSMKLDANSYQSGIAMMVEQSEANNEIEDKQQYFKAVEHRIWEVITLWMNFLIGKNLASGKFADVGPMSSSDAIMIKFLEIKPPVSEKERLEVMQMRKDLGLDNQLDLIKRDNPDLTEKEAELKLKGIIEEKLQRTTMFKPVANEEDVEDEDELEDDGN